MPLVIDELPWTEVTGDEARAPVAAAPDVRARDSALARQLAAGDSEAFDEVVEVYAPRISRLAYRLLGWSGSAADVEDVVQDVFVAVLRHARNFDERSSLSTWITSIAVNHCRSLRRRWSARVRAMAAVFARARRSGAARAADEAAIRDDEAERVREAVRRLRPADREVIVLHYLEQADAAEVAAILGVSRNAVEVRLHRARVRLRAMLERESDL
jgi:RNA polymerase sigma-70 factor (ECF subfamily)